MQVQPVRGLTPVVLPQQLLGAWSCLSVPALTHAHVPTLLQSHLLPHTHSVALSVLLEFGYDEGHDEKRKAESRMAD